MPSAKHPTPQSPTTQRHTCRRATRYTSRTQAARAADDFNRTHPYAPTKIASVCAHSHKRDQHWHVERP